MVKLNDGKTRCIIQQKLRGRSVSELAQACKRDGAISILKKFGKRKKAVIALRGATLVSRGMLK